MFRDAAHLYATPLTEDGFYSLSVARNIAAGHGLTIDGTHPTNGFQPLFTLAEAGCYWLAQGDETLAIRLVFALSWALYLAGGGLIGRLAADAVDGRGADAVDGPAADAVDGPAAERRARFWIAATLYLGGFLSFMHAFNALETGAVIVGYAGIARLYQQGRYARRSGPALFGLLLGLLVLTRIDAAVFAAMFIGWRFVADMRTAPGPAFRAALITGALALAVSAPWWWYNWHVFGAVMPTSGSAQQAWSLDERRLRWVFWALGAAALPTLWLGRFDEVWRNGLILSALRGAVALALAVGFARAARRRATPRTPTTERTLAFGRMLAAALAALAIYYALSFVAFWFYYRYLFPTVIVATVAIAWLAAPWALRRPATAGALALALAAPTLASAVMAQRGRTLHVETVYWQQVALVAAHVPADQPVAAGQAGTLGYFRPNSVDVDGKVNSAVIARQDRMWDYLRDQHVDWFCDWPNYVEKYLGRDPAAHGWRLVDRRGIWELWRYDRPTG